MKKNLFERFRDGELGEIQKRAFYLRRRRENKCIAPVIHHL